MKTAKNATAGLDVTPKCVPALDPGFVPAVLWNRAYRARVAATGGGTPLGLALVRGDGTTFVHRDRILPHRGADAALNLRYVERLVKFLLWQKGGCALEVAGCPALARALGRLYGAKGARAFDRDLVGRRMFGRPLEVRAVEALPRPREATQPLGRHLDGCRIGFDLGGSDRKCAALIDGKVVFSEEIKWNPYFEKDPWYHLAGVQDSLRRAAAKLPRVDAIGGSAAGVYVNNEVRVASLFRGIADADFDRHIRRMFFALKEWWGGVPFEVVNDGEVTALAGSMALKAHAVLGISLGTSVAAGYVNPEGNITSWLNELAFVPVDYRADAPADEWSGDLGCAVQYFSQQGVARLAARAGLTYPKAMPPAERLEDVQRRMAAGEPAARAVYDAIGVCFGYSIAHFAEFYRVDHVLVLGRVTSGEGGAVILARAGEVLRTEFPERARQIRLRTPDEQMKRHGQAVAAASLPELPRGGRR